jgi:hypothetical protein
MRPRRFVLVLPATLLLLLLAALYTAQTGPARLPLEAAFLEAGNFQEGDGATGEVMQAEQISLTVAATVGLAQNECASTRRVRVFPDTRVYYCYQAENTGTITLERHTISDTLVGRIWDDRPEELRPGETLEMVRDRITVAESQRVDVTWTASTDEPAQSITAVSEALVDVIRPAFEITKTVGMSPTACATENRVLIPPGGDAQYCLIIANTGEITFTGHHLEDGDLGVSGRFAYTLGPSQRLTITEASLEDLGIEGSLVRSGVTQTLTNTAAYSATTIDGYARGDGNITSVTVTDTATATVALAQAQVVFTKTIGTQESVCADTINLSVADPNTWLYYCAILHNTGDITVTRHALAEPGLGLNATFTHTLAPNDIYTITNDILDAELGQSRSFGPYTLYYGNDLTLNFTMFYTGNASAQGGWPAYTTTASANAFAGLNVTQTPTPTYTPTRSSSGSSPTNTPWPTSTPTWTPIPPAPTPTPTDTPPFPTVTPTPTRSYAISLLETPTSIALSPLDASLEAAAAQATLDAQSTLSALETAAALSPLATPSETPTPPPSPLLAAADTPPAEERIIMVTNTPPPPGALAQRPIELPTPTPTPDVLLFAALAVDKTLLAAAWIWFALGSLVFFAVAGLVAGLSFRQAERRRFDLLKTDAATLDDAGLLPPPPPPRTPRGEDNWPDSLP